MWVARSRSGRPARVAIQPPRVENSKLCGKCRSVRPCGLSASSSAGPSAPPWTRAARLISSTSTTRSSRCRSRDSQGAAPRYSTPPTTDEPPPYGTTAAPAARPSRGGDHVVASVRGTATRSGGFVEVAVQRPDDVAVGLPVGVGGPGQGVRGEGLFEDRRRDQPGPVEDRVVGDRRDRPVDRHPRPQRPLGELEARLVVEGLIGPAPAPPRALPPPARRPAHDEAACHTIPYGVRRARRRERPQRQHAGLSGLGLAAAGRRAGALQGAADVGSRSLPSSSLRCCSGWRSAGPALRAGPAAGRIPTDSNLDTPARVASSGSRSRAAVS